MATMSLTNMMISDTVARSCKEAQLAQKMYKAKITPAAGGSPVEVTVPANDMFQAKKMIESQYGPVKAWWQNPTEIR